MKSTSKIETLLSEAAQNPLNRRRNRRRQRIVAAASRLFELNGGESAGGYENTTVEQIADEADISVRTFFRYFGSKADAIYLDMETARRDYFSMVEARLQENASVFDACLDARIEQVRNFCEDPDDRARFIHAFHSDLFLERHAIMRAKWRRELAKLLETPRKRGQVSNIEANTIASICIDLSSAVLEAWARHPDAGEPHALLKEACISARELLSRSTLIAPKMAAAKR